MDADLESILTDIRETQERLTSLLCAALEKVTENPPLAVTPEPEFLSVKEAAEATSLSSREIRRLILEGEIEKVERGRRILILPESLRAYKTRLVERQVQRRRNAEAYIARQRNRKVA